MVVISLHVHIEQLGSPGRKTSCFGTGEDEHSPVSRSLVLQPTVDQSSSSPLAGGRGLRLSVGEADASSSS